jgi:hypothetical protein
MQQEGQTNGILRRRTCIEKDLAKLRWKSEQINAKLWRTIYGEKRLFLEEPKMDGDNSPKLVNSNVVKKYYV